MHLSLKKYGPLLTSFWKCQLSTSFPDSAGPTKDLIWNKQAPNIVMSPYLHIVLLSPWLNVLLPDSWAYSIFRNITSVISPFLQSPHVEIGWLCEYLPLILSDGPWSSSKLQNSSTAISTSKKISLFQPVLGFRKILLLHCYLISDHCILPARLSGTTWPVTQLPSSQNVPLLKFLRFILFLDIM